MGMPEECTIDMFFGEKMFFESSIIEVYIIRQCLFLLRKYSESHNTLCTFYVHRFFLLLLVLVYFHSFYILPFSRLLVWFLPYLTVGILHYVSDWKMSIASRIFRMVSVCCGSITCLIHMSTGGISIDGSHSDTNRAEKKLA